MIMIFWGIKLLTIIYFYSFVSGKTKCISPPNKKWYNIVGDEADTSTDVARIRKPMFEQ